MELWDFLDEGIRPVVEEPTCGECRQCLDVCPGLETDFALPASSPTVAGTEECGTVVGVWEGHATDPEIRFKGSSGGLLTALAQYCLEREEMEGVLHIGPDPRDPLRNRARMSRDRSDLLAATGSRYSPAAIGGDLDAVENSSAACVVIGKPGEIAGLRKAAQMRPELAKKIGVAMSFFCAESPSTAGTIALLNRLEVLPETVADLRYRGNGWPGHFAPTCHGESTPKAKLTYRDSWAFLQAFRPWSVHLWPDGTGELADITCGDPWYEQPDGTNPGFSLVVARTKRGRDIVEGAIRAGYVSLTPAEGWKLTQSQRNLIEKKRNIWGRQTALRLLRLPAPRFRSAHLFRGWLRLPLTDKVKSLVGTIRRVVRKGLTRPLKLDRNRAVKLERLQPRPKDVLARSGGAHRNV